MEEKLNAIKKFDSILDLGLKRAKELSNPKDFNDFKKNQPIKIGILGGDGIGPTITQAAKRVLEHILAKEIKDNKVILKTIEGLTIENRLAKGCALPKEVLCEVKKCNVILKGPTTTPRQTDKTQNIESANVALRKELDLYANIRPVKVKEKGIDWTFFRENTEGGYALGSKGININDELYVDFTITTKSGSRRIAKAAFEYAKNNGKKKVSIITKANVIKTTDGAFLKECLEVSKDYKEIEVDDWYVDIAAAKLIDQNRRSEFEVFVLPNLYGDILTDEAAQIQGGVGTAGSANVGDNYAMFEAIHGSAPRMVAQGREKFSDPCSMLRASVMMLSHIGFKEKADLLEQALDFAAAQNCVVITGRKDGARTDEFVDYIIDVCGKK